MRLLSVAVSFFVAVAALLGAGVATAQDVVPIPPLNGRVVDTTGTLTALQTQALSAKLEAIETKNGSQVVILMVPTTAPEDIAAFSQRAG
ncbi:MAG: TPM domain-containing protein, partial [Caldimonas sp.]